LFHKIIYINNIEYGNISLVGRTVDETGKRENDTTGGWGVKQGISLASSRNAAIS